MKRRCKSPSDSSVEMREMVMPNHTNSQNSIFGGQVMAWIDIAAAMAASRHCNKNVLTIHVDDLTFLAPIPIGHHILIQSSVNYVGRTSLEVGCRVTSENPITGDKRHTTSAYLTFVCVDEFGRPTMAPGLTPQTEEEKRRFENAKIRYEARKETAKKIKK